MKHKLTVEQAKRIRYPELAGQFVDVELYKANEKTAKNKNTVIAKHIYHDGKCIGSLLDLS